MAEAMTVETVAEAYWQLQDYWTRLRVPFQTARSDSSRGGGWSDADLLAYKPTAKRLVICESKVRFGRSRVLTHPEGSEGADSELTSYLSFRQHIPQICKCAGLDPLAEHVASLTVHLVSNYHVKSELQQRLRTKYKAETEEQLAAAGISLSVEYQLDTTFEVFCRVLELEQERGQGRRHGHPVLDLARELNRYAKCTATGAGRGASEELRAIFIGRLNASLNAGQVEVSAQADDDSR
jgi:hypothetical protein